MKPYLHALKSAKKYGGSWKDYVAIHDFMDSSKAHIPDVRHRAIFHNSFGCFVVEKMFGHNITNSEGKKVSVRDIAEEHIIEDLGWIPTVQDYLKHMTIEEWMGGLRKETKFKPFKGETQTKKHSTEDFKKFLEEKRKELINPINYIESPIKLPDGKPFNPKDILD